MNNELAEKIDTLLPQTQCGKCGFNGCRPYAEAISRGQADINRCPPGGERGVEKLAALLNVGIKPLDPAVGAAQPRLAAVINEDDCIGCTKCIPPCPVDAIIGASKQMHSVINQYCTGCELCVAPCPVNCISMEAADPPTWSQADADQARSRYQSRNLRLARLEAEKIERHERQKKQLALLMTAKQ